MKPEKEVNELEEKTEGNLKKQYVKVFINRMIRASIILCILGFILSIDIREGILQPNEIKSSSDITEDIGYDGDAYVRVSQAAIYDTGYTYTEDEEDKAKYYLVELEDQYIVALLCLDVAEQIEDYQFNGKMRELNEADQQAVNFIGADLIQSGQDWTEEEVEFGLNQKYVIESLDYKGGYLLSFYFFLIGTAVAAFFVLFYLYFVLNPRKHKSYRMLKDFGNIDYVEEVIDRDFTSRRKYYDAKNVKIMEHYMVVKTMFHVKVFKTEEIMWVYELVTKHRAYFIPIGKTYTLEVKFSTPNKYVSIPMKNQRTAGEALALLQQTLPHIIYGYDQRLIEMYNKNFAEFVSQWKEYKAEKQRECFSYCDRR